MLIIFLILTFSHTLEGVPIPTSTDHDSSTLVNRDNFTSGSDDMNLRSTYDLVSSCVLTVLACVWTSAHPNIPGPTDSPWTCLKRRLVMMICALIAPELMAMWALRQYIAAKKIAHDYNTTTVRDEISQNLSLWESLRQRLGESIWGLPGWLIKSLRDSVKEYFTELPRERSRRGQGQTWTATHGFFIQMGGFLLYEDEYPKRVLDYDDMKQLIRNNNIDAPMFTESDLQDRSKGDGISKGLVVIQTTWFVCQCIARLSKHLPLSELEVVTLGFAVLNGIIYAVWWNKPQGVGAAIFIPLKRKEVHSGKVGSREAILEVDEKEVTANTSNPEDMMSALQADPDSTGMATPSSLDNVVEEKITVKGGWLRRQLVKDWSRHHWLVYTIVRIPLRFGQFLFRPLDKMGANHTVPPGSSRMPMFYADNRGEERMTLYASCLIGTVFGAVHLLAWWSNFPSRTEQLLWRISTVVIISEPMLTVMVNILNLTLTDYNDTQLVRTLYIIVDITFFVAAPFYVAARFALIILAFLSLRALPPSIFLTISWTSFIPHL